MACLNPLLVARAAQPVHPAELGRALPGSPKHGATVACVRCGGERAWRGGAVRGSAGRAG